MQEIIALLAPALIAIGFYSHLHRNKLQAGKLISSYGVFVVLINLCMYLVTLQLLGHDKINFDDQTFINYLICASIFAVLLPFVVNLVENTIAIDVRKNVKK